ncbi:Oxygen-independent coproporphyrinogen-III oxidase-like protein YqeR [Bacillus paralicheniformis]|uniref:radical SAM family heme chaperone HemW n=1 Tax=Bacillus paralicheniformis TaxID=1648923 RepID=UPI0007414DB6|nr:radical SAM family heme chaperone HemW [Bacillus paralicheniformis]KUL17107.1 coproporphyrinogen III oxidase [Bacillus licheniformis LMG 6934]MBG9883584.1 coproporphyrinogen III oxidase [Bacillus paralicheniformis]MDE1381531.1 radical SAM family heme chaperone HemW [Bacillus paralicheniformis]MDE1392144.1 radical SAM family heme chaperone HemW [Bacillus paralicheniformis]TWJ52158.1 Oxygen-independent coproporphyrinogen-III oxidase-like protein YqeR [Bacillus paralicheniformis]
MKAAYIHIPFCEHICHYCDFNKFFIQSQPVDEYLRSLEKEMANSMEAAGHPELKTIFIGGGTPTSLSAAQLERLLDSIHRVLKPSESLAEFAVEANPDDLSAEKLDVLKAAGVDRLSFGVQTFEDELLKKIGRVHEQKDVLVSFERARNAGFDNISLDLMFGLPGQTIGHFASSLDTALALGAEHYSVYSLIVEPKTVFYNLMKKGRLHLPPQDQEAEMYELVMRKMEEAGIGQYEISNYAKKGYESKHNLTYWNNEEYFGLGAGAHGYINGERTVNAGPVKHYIDLIEQSGFPYKEKHRVTKNEQIEEEMFLGLRKTAGVDKEHFFQKYGRTVDDLFPKVLRSLEETGLIVNTSNNVFLTHNGKLLGNEVFQAFLGEL